MKKNEVIFITCGSYSDTEYRVFTVLKPFNTVELVEISAYARSHEFVHDYLDSIEPIHCIALLENRGYVKELEVPRTVSFGYSVDADIYDNAHPREELDEARTQLRTRTIIKKQD